MKKLSILNIKGGVGKTTSTINLASTLAEEGKKVLIVDIDAQSNSTMLFKAYDIDALSVSDILLDKNINVEDVIKGTDFDNIDVLPSNISLAFTEKKILLDVTRNQQNRLKKALEQVEDKYDYCLIDCPPSLNMITINALVASDEVIVPIKIDKFALDGLGYLLDSIDEVKEIYKTGNVNVFLKKYDEKVSEDENIHIDRYIGQKYNIEIRSIGNKIQSILYVYKY